MSGLVSPTLATMREGPRPVEPDEQEQTVHIDPDQLTDEPGKPSIVVEFDDGSVSINLNPQSAPVKSLADSKFGDNLAEALEETYLNTLADDLLRGIEDDELSRSEWIEERAEGIKLLALKI